MAAPANVWIGLELSGGRYHILAKLGEGGMGLVYSARDRNLETDVVVKVPRRSMLEDPNFAGRFAREVRSLVSLVHPHVVKVNDLGEHNGLPFVVMQYLPGGSLDDRRPTGADGQAAPADPESLLLWLPDIARALDFVHGQGYIHRDVKPANILFDAHCHAFLSDFGIAKALASSGEAGPSRSITGAGMVLGTPEYMAPESIMGQAIDGRADQYALAVTVYEVLAGRRPFDGPTPSAVLVQHSTREPPALRHLCPMLPGPLCDAVHVALAKDPARRYPDCASLARAVAAAAGLKAPAGGSRIARASGESSLRGPAAAASWVQDQGPHPVPVPPGGGLAAGDPHRPPDPKPAAAVTGPLAAVAEPSAPDVPAPPRSAASRRAWVAAGLIVLVVGIGVRGVLRGPRPEGTAGTSLPLPVPVSKTDPVPPRFLLLPIPDQTLDEGELMTFSARLQGSDGAGVRPRFLLEAPAAATGVELNPDTGSFRWRPGEDQGPGTYPMKVVVTTGGRDGPAAEEEFTITVHEANQRPVLAELGSRDAQVGSIVRFDALAVDQDEPGNRLVYSLGDGHPPGARIQPHTGAFTWDTTGVKPGAFIFPIRVIDDGPNPLSDLKNVRITLLAAAALSAPAPRRAVPPSRVGTNGLQVQVFRGAERSRPIGAPEVVAQVEWIGAQGIPAAAGDPDDLTVRWEGWLKPSQAASHTLTLFGNGDMQLLLDDKDLLAASEGRNYLRRKEAIVFLGLVPQKIVIEYRPPRGEIPVICLRWKKQGDAVDRTVPAAALFTEKEAALRGVVPPYLAAGSSHGLRASYQGMGAKKGIIDDRVDPQIDWFWGQGGPHPGMNPRFFECRWVGRIEVPVAGRYELIAIHDDSVQVAIDGRVVIEERRPQPPTRDAAVVDLTKGSHTVRIDYQHRGGASSTAEGALMSFRWRREGGIAEQVVSGEFLFPK